MTQNNSKTSVGLFVERISFHALSGLLLIFVVSGCASSLLNLSDSEPFSVKFAQLMGNDPKRDREEDNDFDTSTKIETPLLRDYISVAGNNLVALRGVGLVTGLDGTGGDPPPSHLRKELLDDMAKMKIPNPSRILASRNTALVMVTAYLPPMVREGQPFDVRVTLPPNSEATSLRGGRLLETRLAEEQAVAGRGNLKGHQYAIATGAILTALGDGGDSNAAMMRRGSIPGGAVSKTERNLEVILKNEHRGLKTSKRIENAISNRLHHYNRLGQRIPMAEAKTDMLIELRVHPTYRNNFPRYQQMIRSIAYRETAVSRRLRMERLAEKIMDPKTSSSAALQLEAIGRDGIPFLQAALKSPSRECQFHAAQSLAYLEDSSGVDVLKEAAMDEPAFRVYALAALSVINDADSIMALRELIADGQLETRYGAVRALKENNPHDSTLGTVDFPKQFLLHAIDSGTEPAVHVVRYRAPEVVVFGSRQKLRLPAVLNAGSRIRVIGKAGEDHVTITKYQISEPTIRRKVSANLVEILREMAALGARYPDVVQLLLEADEQANLAGELGIDRLPQAGRTFLRNPSEDDGESEQRTRVGTPSLIPGLFDRLEESEQHNPEEEESALSRMFAMTDRETPGEDGEEIAEPLIVEDEGRTPGQNESSEGISAETIDADSIQEMNLGETAGEMDEDVEIEQTEFQEPMTSRIRRVLLSPFKRN